MYFRNLKPLHDHIAVVFVPPPTEEKIGSLVVPVDPKLLPHREAIVMAVGPGRHTPEGLAKPECRPGDRVLLNKQVGFAHDFRIGEDPATAEKWVIVPYASVLSIISESPAPLLSYEVRGYFVILTPGKQEWTARVPAIPDCSAAAAGLGEVLELIEEAIEQRCFQESDPPVLPADPVHSSISAEDPHAHCPVVREFQYRGVSATIRKTDRGHYSAWSSNLDPVQSPPIPGGSDGCVSPEQAEASFRGLVDSARKRRPAEAAAGV